MDRYIPDMSTLRNSNPHNALLNDLAFSQDIISKSKRGKIDYQRNTRYNIDGFGMGFYPDDLVEPCLYKTIHPACSDVNLKSLGKLRSRYLFAHIRSASGGPDNNALFNCHPFQFDKILFMHNGGVSRFTEIKKKLINVLSDYNFQRIHGTTDTEYVAALFCDYLGDTNRNWSALELGLALKKTVYKMVTIIREYEMENGLDHTASSLNLAVTNGTNVAVCRYRDSLTEKPPSLFFSAFDEFSHENGNLSLHVPPEGCDFTGVLIASEPLTNIHSQWAKVQSNSLFMINNDSNELSIHSELLTPDPTPEDLL